MTRPIRWSLAIGLLGQLGCGDLLFDAPPLRIESLQVEFRSFPDTLTLGDSALATIRVVSQDGEDVTDFTAISWRSETVDVVRLNAGEPNVAKSRYVRAVGEGHADVTVSARYLNEIVSPPTNATVTVIR